MLQYQDNKSPLHSLEQAAIQYASAITLNSKDPRLHFLLGLVLEEHHYATEMYGLQKKVFRVTVSHEIETQLLTFQFQTCESLLQSKVYIAQ